jgi:hypothetical protein
LKEITHSGRRWFRFHLQKLKTSAKVHLQAERMSHRQVEANLYRLP